MNEDTRVGLIILISLLLFISLVALGGYAIIKQDEKISILRDSECQRLGYEKSLVMGFHSYCVEGGNKIEVIGNCDSVHCTYVFE